MTIDKQQELYDKIFAGLKKSFEQLIEIKKQRNTDFVVLRDNKIVKIKPDQINAIKNQ